MKSLLISSSDQQKLIQNESDRRRTLRLVQVCDHLFLVRRRIFVVLLDTTVGETTGCSTSTIDRWREEETNVSLDRSTESEKKTALSVIDTRISLRLGWVDTREDGITRESRISISRESDGNGQKSQRSSRTSTRWEENRGMHWSRS